MADLSPKLGSRLYQRLAAALFGSELVFLSLGGPNCLTGRAGPLARAFRPRLPKRHVGFLAEGHPDALSALAHPNLAAILISCRVPGPARSERACRLVSRSKPVENGPCKQPPRQFARCGVWTRPHRRSRPHCLAPLLFRRPRLSRGPPVEALAGLVERVTFHNADSGFCVLRVKARGQRDLVTVVGHAASIAPASGCR